MNTACTRRVVEPSIIKPASAAFACPAGGVSHQMAGFLDTAQSETMAPVPFFTENGPSCVSATVRLRIAEVHHNHGKGGDMSGGNVAEGEC